jgi:hypothetical protein
VESKIRILVGNFERNDGVKLVHVNTEQFTPAKKDECVLYKSVVINILLLYLVINRCARCGLLGLN